MIPVVVFRRPGESILDPDAVELFAEQHFDTDSRIRETWGRVCLYQAAVMEMFIKPVVRAEGYVYADDGFTPVGMAMYSRVLDIHYGLMAQPIMIFVDPKYRGDMTVNRAVSQLVRKVVKRLDVGWYNVPKHPAQDVQQFTTRRIHGRSS